MILGVMGSSQEKNIISNLNFMCHKFNENEYLMCFNHFGVSSFNFLSN